MKKEFETSYHILYLSIMTVFGILLIIVNIMSEWSESAVPAVAFFLTAGWTLHFLELGEAKVRLYIYVFMELFFLLYYGYHRQAITDIPLILCLMIVLLSGQKDIHLIHMVALSYLAILFENLFINHFLFTDFDQLVFSRILLGVFSLICAVTASRFFLRKSTDSERKIKELKEELENAYGENTKFLSNVSHELRTPINAVNGISEILLHKGLPSEIHSEIQVIQDAGRRLYHQVGDMIDFSEIQTGHYIIQEENYEPLSAVNDAVEEVFGRHKKNKDFAIDLEASMPKVLWGDMQKIKKMIACLLDNAVKFTNEGGGYLYVSKREEDYGINLNIDLWDTGIGMEQKEISKFYQIDTYQKDKVAERNVRGLGLGLYIVCGIVAGMKGFMTIQSKKGKGTHVHISIPQQVKNIEPSIKLENSSDYKIISYINTEKFPRKEVAQYYYTLLEHLMTELKLEIHETFSMEELKTSISQTSFTHIFVGRWEYEMDPSFFMEVSQKLHVFVFSDQKMAFPKNLKITLLLKPLYILSIVNSLKLSMEQKRVPLIKKASEKKEGEKPLALIVDDDDMNLVVARGILSNLGIRVKTCTSGEQAIRVCTDHDYDIVFMDYMMPEMNGIEAMRRIRKIREGFYENRPIVALTANAISSARASFLQEGFDEFISKPIEVSAMKVVLKKMLSWEVQV